MASLRHTPNDAAEVIRAAAWPLIAGKTYERMLTWLGDASLVFLGAASHGTHDFHAARAALTRRLIEDRQFTAVLVDGDWNDAREINRYVQGLGGRDPATVLRSFFRFPSWPWRNTALAEFAAWLHEHNMSKHESRRVGIYGLDLYSTQASMRGTVDFLSTVDAVAARAARASFGAFDCHAEDAERYPWAAADGRGDALIRHLLNLRERRRDWLRHDGPMTADEQFYLRQEERLAANAEHFYRWLLTDRVDAWNVRTRHLFETLEALATDFNRVGRPAKFVVWADNAQVGDAIATELSRHGYGSLGQLTRQAEGAALRTIGFTTYTGTVVAAADWDEGVEVRKLEPALEGSYEELFHRVGVPRFFLPLNSGAEMRQTLAEPRLERALGFVYRPEQERWSHYFEANLAHQFDAVVHVDQSHALEPLERIGEWDTAPYRHVVPV